MASAGCAVGRCLSVARSYTNSKATANTVQYLQKKFKDNAWQCNIVKYCRITTNCNSLGMSRVYFLARIISGERIWATRHATRNLVIRPM